MSDERKHGMSRREFLRNASLIAAGALLLTACPAPGQSGAAPAAGGANAPAAAGVVTGGGPRSGLLRAGCRDGASKLIARPVEGRPVWPAKSGNCCSDVTRSRPLLQGGPDYRKWRGEAVPVPRMSGSSPRSDKIVGATWDCVAVPAIPGATPAPKAASHICSEPFTSSP